MVRSRAFEKVLDNLLYKADLYEMQDILIELQTISTKYFSLISDEKDYNRVYEIKELIK